MTDLTEQLKDGLYYIKDTNDNIYIDDYDKGIDEFTFTDKVKEVLAPVPSYEEYLEMEGHCAAYSDINQWQKEEISAYKRLVAELQEENTKLKELLKECREPLEVLAEKRNACDWYPEDLLAKINQALGEYK